MKKIMLLVAALVLLISIALTGCSSGGIAQADYDAVLSQLADARTELNQAKADLTTAQADVTKSQADKAAAQSSLQAAQASITSLEQQLADLKAQYESVGATTTEIVTGIVKSYYESHLYQKDVYDCNNYASDVWDMLQKLNIDSVIVIGDVQTGVSDILNTTHAWVLVDVENGEKLAFDATTGKPVTKAENPLYYQGWTFNDPAALKANDDLKTEYNTRVSLRNILADEVNAAQASYNNAPNQTEADKYMVLYTKLKELKDAQEAILIQLAAQVNGLAVKL